MEQKMPWKRLRHYAEIVGMTLLVSFFFAYQNGLLLDQIVAYLTLDAIFLAVLLCMLEHSRIHHKIGNSASNHYGRISACYGILCIITAAFYFFPAFTFPAAAFALFLNLRANAEISVGLSVLLSILYCTASGGNFYELAAYCTLIFIGSWMAEAMHEKKHRPWGCLILLFSALCIPSLFYYLAYSKSQVQLFLWNGEFIACAILLYYMLANKLYDQKDQEELDAYEAIIQEDYPLVKDIKNYSKAEYVHAIKVATISGKCAAEIGANEIIAAAAGFYYRLGVLEGEPFVKNAVRLAQENCFPSTLIEILSEYNGEWRLPSSKESAIVHMVDTCVKRIEMLSSQNLSSSWNQDMVIYQTLNEVSATGIYDESGVSMNQFLKVRELLVREEIGYDNNN